MINTQLFILTGIAGAKLDKYRGTMIEGGVSFPSLSKDVTVPVQQLNRNIYNKLGMSWSSFASLSTASPWMKEFVEKALKTLSLLNKSEPLGICDPLMARTLPVWVTAAMLLGLTQVNLVYVYAKPSTTSLRLHSEHGLPIEQGYKLWMNQAMDFYNICSHASMGNISIANVVTVNEEVNELHTPKLVAPHDLAMLVYQTMDSVL